MEYRKIDKFPVVIKHPDFTLTIYDHVIILDTWGKRYVITVDKVRNVFELVIKRGIIFELGKPK